jgi:steroid delta-isomerase-like uncharacterized protein
VSDQNKAIIRRFIEVVINGGDLDALARFWSEDFAWHGLGTSIHGLDQLRGMLAAYAAAIPDHRVEEGLLIAERDLVAGQWTAHGTHRGPLMGVPATGRRVEFQALDVYRLRDGKIVEQWAGDDLLSLLQQIGALPAAAAP